MPLARTSSPAPLRLAAALIAVALLAPAPAAARSPAVPEQRISVPGLREPVEILVDRWGVPHIFAKGEDDLFFAQGWNAARDRLFQLDLWRRRGLGELAEALGPSFVEQDRAARLFLYRGDMDREWRAYSSTGTREAERIAAAFVAGVNAYVDHVAAHPEALPWEFQRLGYAPARWRPEDVVRIRSHGLTRNLTSEVARANTACKADLAADELRFGLSPPWEAKLPEGLDPCLPKDVLKVFSLATQGVTVGRGAARTARGPGEEGALLASAPPQDEADGIEAEGSNNWVIAPARSATGRAILANDPHRAYSVPSLRYIAHLSAPGLDVIGAGEPALPGISIGHNGTIAFGLTIFSIDQEDLYVYELDPADPGRYRYRGGFEPFRVIREAVNVKGAAPATVDLAFTRHGPVIYVDREKNRAYAVRSGWLEPGMSPYFGSVDSMRARDFASFKRSLAGWGAPTLNHVYADVKGNIGWVPRGLTPKRPDWDGLLPVPGDGRFEWDGFWRGDDLPSAYDPPEGFLATANQMNLPADYPYRQRRIGFEWTNDSRYRRVSEVLSAPGKISIEDSMRLQNDLLSVPARRLLALLAPLSSPDARIQAALDLLRGWDAVERPDAAQPALFEVWLSRHLGRAFLNAALPRPAADAIPSADVAVLLDALERPVPRLGQDAAGAALRRDETLLASLGTAWAEMERLQGPDARAWQWGRLHHDYLAHPFTQAVSDGERARINVGPLPKGGGAYTPNQSTYRTSDFRHVNGPSFRLVVDVGNWDASRAVNFPGQSGDPASPHYRDLVPSWVEGGYFPLLYSRKAIEAAAERRIVLAPARR
jgi:penicillin G amidase